MNDQFICLDCHRVFFDRDRYDAHKEEDARREAERVPLVAKEQWEHRRVIEDAPVSLEVWNWGGRYYLAPLTPCCNASGKGGGYGVICRSCHQDVNSQFGSGTYVERADDDPFWWVSFHQLLQEEIWDMEFQGPRVVKEADKWVAQAKAELKELFVS